MNFYPRSPCGERRRHCGDNRGPIDFYPRSPCGERRTLLTLIIGFLGFLSTLSLRRATSTGTDTTTDNQNFYPRSPCGERPNTGTNSSKNVVFLSTLSLRRATFCISHQPTGISISIHALLAESDQANAVDQILPGHISIHALLAESDRSKPLSRQRPSKFLSTLSLRRATFFW